jgi:hypothetical protein
LADYLAAEMNQSAGDKPISNPAGIHVAGFQPWADGVSRATFYHVHNGRSEPKIKSWTTEVNGQKVIVKREIDGSFDPRTKFKRHNDFSPENPKSSDQIKLLDDPHQSYITHNGDYYAFTLIAELPSLLPLQQLLQRIFVLVFKFVRLKVPRFGFDNVGGKFQHVLWDFFVRNILEIFILFAHLRIAQRNPEKPLATRFEGDDVLAGGEHNPPERHHAFLADRLANDRKRLLADFAIGSEVVGAV